MTCKLTYFFADNTSSTGSGWTESWYVGAGDANTALAVATAPGWLNERLAVLNPTYYLTSIRAQNVVNRFDSKRMRFTAATGIGQYGGAAGRANAVGDPPWTGVLLNLFGGTTTIRRFILRGIPDSQVDNNLEYSPSPRFRAALDTWRDDLSVAPNAYQLRHISLFQTWSAPTTITVQPDKKTVILSWAPGIAPAALTKGVVVQLPGIQNATPVTGFWRVHFFDGMTVTMYPRRRPIFGTPTVPSAVQQMQYTYTPISDTEVTRGAERRPGRPSDQLRGRARAR